MFNLSRTFCEHGITFTEVALTSARRIFADDVLLPDGKFVLHEFSYTLVTMFSSRTSETFLVEGRNYYAIKNIFGTIYKL